MDFKKNIAHGWHDAGRGLRALADLILPRVCIVCEDRLLLQEKHICLHCLADMPLTRFWERSHNPMADKFNAVIQERLEGYEHYVFATALFFFSSDAPYRHILYDIKYEGRTDIGRHFGRMLGLHLSGSEVFRDVDCVIPVPLHWTRRWRRGYNQAEVIAQGVASVMGVPLDCRTLVRRRRTRTQTRIDVKDKAANVVKAFGVRKTGTVSACHVRHVLLIDDLYTTGSTLYACFKALRSVFPPEVRISIATLGFVGRA